MARTEQLTKAGQSIWLDNITRDLLDDGSIERCITDLAVTGLTSNPSIFDKAIAGAASDADEVGLLEELAADIAFGLHRIEVDTALRESELR